MAKRVNIARNMGDMDTVKKIFIAGILLIIVFTLFACGGKKDENFKIDIGGEVSAGKIPAACQTRVMLENDTFARKDGVKIIVGFGLIDFSLIEHFMSQDLAITLKIDAQNFLISDADDNKVENLFEKIFEGYLDSKFVCTIKKNRYIPNYSETFEIKLNSDTESVSGFIQASAVIIRGEENRDGKIVTIFYAANSDKITFSTISIANAQSKL